jgi:hypothetical protein
MNHLEAYWRRFVNRADTYCVQQPPPDKYRRVRRALTLEDLAAHVAGEKTLALDCMNPEGEARWVCWDSDVVDGLADLARVQAAAMDLGLVTYREASRRGGHLWLWCDAPQPVAALHRLGKAVMHLADIKLEVYPNRDDPPRDVAQGMRLPLGIHQHSGQRYPFVDGAGRPCHRDDPESALAWLVAQPHTITSQLQAALATVPLLPPPRAPVSPSPLVVTPTPSLGGAAVTKGIIGWIRAQSFPDIVARTRSDVALMHVGRGYSGWCPLHDDAAPQADGTPGTRSLYIYCDPVYGWRWKCLSSNCGASQRPVKDAFDWLVWLSGGQWNVALRWAEALREESR